MGGSERRSIAAAVVRVLPVLLLPGCEALLGLPTPQLLDGDAAVPVLLRVSISGTAGTRGLPVRVTGPDGLDCPGKCTLSVRPGEPVTLSAADVSGAEFRGWRGAGEGCGSAATCTLTLTTPGELSARWDLPHNVVFVSSLVYTADFGRGVDAHAFADGECQAMATAADLPPGPYVAWIGTMAEPAIMHLGQVSGWVRPDGETFALDSAALIDGRILYPARLDENGVDVGNALMLTGTTQDGLIDANCSDWSKGPPPGGGFSEFPLTAGEAGGSTVVWTAGRGTLSDCGKPGRFYCFGKGKTDSPPAAPVAPVITSANETDVGRIWVSTVKMTPGSGSGFGLASSLCRGEGVDREAIALIGEPGVAAGLRVLRVATQEAPVRFVRPDGVAVAASFLDLAEGRLLAAPNLTIDGAFVGPSELVWLGSATLEAGSPIQACGDWQNGDSGLSGRAATAATSFIRADQQPACSNPQRLLCVDFPIRQFK